MSSSSLEDNLQALIKAIESDLLKNKDLILDILLKWYKQQYI